jgi:hypothetical protein
MYTGADVHEIVVFLQREYREVLSMSRMTEDGRLAQRKERKKEQKSLYFWAQMGLTLSTAIISILISALIIVIYEKLF